MIDVHAVRTRLEQAVAAREEHAQLVRRIDALRPALFDLEGEVDRRRAALADETADVERLESLSATGIWARLRGSHASELERETAERDAARYAAAEAEARLAVLRREKGALEERLAGLSQAEAEYHAALRAKEEWLAAAGEGPASEVAEIAERRGRLQALERETREAYDSGREALALLHQARSSLGSAGSWSTWDTFGGGGMFTDLMKYQKVDQATDAVRQADFALARFSHELADLSLDGVASVEVDTLMRTFDVWFDNIFSDLAVRSRIQDATDRVGRAAQQVELALHVVADKGRALQAELAELDRRREQLLLG